MPPVRAREPASGRVRGLTRYRPLRAPTKIRTPGGGAILTRQGEFWKSAVLSESGIAPPVLAQSLHRAGCADSRNRPCAIALVDLPRTPGGMVILAHLYHCEPRLGGICPKFRGFSHVTC